MLTKSEVQTRERESKPLRGLVKFLFSFIFLFIVTSVFHSSVYAATVYYVAGDTGLDTNDGSISTPWKTIQKAADTMVAGDTVNVKGDMSYNEKVTTTNSGSEGNYITYQGWSGTGIPIVDATGKTDGFYINKGYIKVSGFIIKNASSNGVTLFAFYSNLHSIITNNILLNNAMMGIYNQYTFDPTISSNIFYNNGLGGFHSDGDEDVTVKLHNNISVANGFFGGLSVSSGIHVISNNNDSWGNADSKNYYHISPGDHDLSQDPLFLDATNNDFRLAANSALINAGTTLSEVTTDILGTIRPQGSEYDIGAYEFDSVPGEQVSIEPLPQNPIKASNLILLSHIDGESNGDQFGSYVGGPNMQVLDVNQDGYEDLIAGARYHYTNGVDRGGVYVFNGKTNFVDVSATNADTIIRESVYGAFGELNLVGDINGDGVEEFISSHYRYYPGHTGIAYIFNKSILNSGTGSSTDAIATIIGPSSTARFGVYGAILGDINKDGYKDYAFGGAVDNKAYVFYGEQNITSKIATNASVIYTNDINSEVVSFVRSEFDINGDGFKDVGIVCSTCNTYGALYIFKGSNNLSNKNLSQADVIISGESGKNIGTNVVAGDFDGNGLDDLAVGSIGIYLFKGNNNYSSTQISLADSIISTADPDFPSDVSVSSLYTTDLNNDSCPDLILSNTIPRIYVLYGCSGLSSLGLSDPDLIYVGSGDMSYRVGNSFESGDFNGDGYKEIFTSDPIFDTGNYKGRIYILGIPHGSPSISLNSIGNTNNLSISGTVTDTLTVGGVEASTDNGSWNTCTVSSGNFSCTLSSSLSDGSHSLRLRSKNSLGVYMATREYTSASFTFDHTSPLVDWTDTSGNSKKYQSSGGDNVFTTDTLPTFSFNKSSDTTSGISRYEIVVNGNTYITNIDPNKPGDKDYREDDDKYVKYEGDTISVRAKKDKDKLVTGKAYKWRVRVVDSAGNSTDTGEKILRINTHEANFSGSFFPISLLSIGEKKTNVTTLHYDQIPSILSINSTTPTFYGIAPVNSKVTLKIEKTNDTNSGRDLVISTTSTANESSRFGINITNKLDKREYFVNFSATNPQGDYVDIPEFKLKVGQSQVYQNTQKPEQKSLIPSLRPQESVKPQNKAVKPTPKQKHCLWFLCW